jgi:hypothetical protein
MGVNAALALLLPALAGQEAPSREDAARALRRAVESFRAKAGVQGGYVWRVSEDLSLREGEGSCTATMAWVQPPGTPSVGLAFLEAYEATGDRAFLDAALETARALVRGQLRSGGWTYSIEFDPEKRKRFAYRADPESRGFNTSTLDDNTTQASLFFLVRADRALGFKVEAVHEAALAGLDALLGAQRPNGGWPQRFEGPADPAKYPARPASFPETWPRTWPAADYKGYYTLNDDLIPDALDALFEAHRVTGEAKYRQAALRAGDFLIQAQMPEPQPAWAQQYDAAMQPAWARKFEPPAVTGGESQGALETLLRLYRETGEKRFLEPVPRALDYLRRSRLPDGSLARFYELRTNAPLYFTRDYELTPSDEDLPTHYGFKPASRLDRISEEFERVKSADPASLKRPEPGRPRLTRGLAEEARRAIEALDGEDLWVTPGRLRTREDAPVRRVLDSRVFIRNAGILSRFLAATKP